MLKHENRSSIENRPEPVRRLRCDLHGGRHHACEQAAEPDAAGHQPCARAAARAVRRSAVHAAGQGDDPDAVGARDDRSGAPVAAGLRGHVEARRPFRSRDRTQAFHGGHARRARADRAARICCGPSRAPRRSSTSRSYAPNANSSRRSSRRARSTRRSTFAWHYPMRCDGSLSTPSAWSSSRGRAIRRSSASWIWRPTCRRSTSW